MQNALDSPMLTAARQAVIRGNCKLGSVLAGMCVAGRRADGRYRQRFPPATPGSGAPGRLLGVATALRIVAGLVLLAVVAIALAWAFQRRLIYLPSGSPAVAPEQLLDGGSAVGLRTEDGPS
jgi:hypothetical protein